ncbi:MAG: glycoside hydrolase family 2 TIM barrel-domain containing protein, partial [Proteiniphilum sp.]
TCEAEGVVTDSREITFGIRKYDYRVEQNSAGWPVMSFYINGRKLFIKGGNWGMSEYLLRTRDKAYEQKIRMHKDMNYNMIRLWTGCVTDDLFYDYCDQYGIMVWDDFWLYVAYNEVENAEHFKQNALDKVKRLRNHPSIALWCGANETHPAPELDNYLRGIIGSEDHNDRMYKSSSNQDGLSGSGWWGNQPPRRHFENSGSNLAWNNPPYPYGSDRGYGLRSEIGMATFPVCESVREFIPQDQLWPLPTDKQLEEDEENVWNRHFFGKAASNASPINYKKAVNEQFGESDNLEAFCEKAQFLNIEVMKGMYEAWNDKMWNDATGILIWMSQSAYPSFVWQTYDYYHDASGAYWGAKKACEPFHIQWNASSNSVKVINSSSVNLENVTATARIFTLQGEEIPLYGNSVTLDVPCTDLQEAFVLDFNPSHLAGKENMKDSSSTATGATMFVTDGMDSEKDALTPVHFVRLELNDAAGRLISENFYWRNGVNELDYRDLNRLPGADISIRHVTSNVNNKKDNQEIIFLEIKNNSHTVAFGNRFRLVDSVTGERILPVIMNDNYLTLMPGEMKQITIEADPEMCKNGVTLLHKQYNQKEKKVLSLEF